jgi:hypothetical protein
MAIAGLFIGNEDRRTRGNPAHRRRTGADRRGPGGLRSGVVRVAFRLGTRSYLGGRPRRYLGGARRSGSALREVKNAHAPTQASYAAGPGLRAIGKSSGYGAH